MSKKRSSSSFVPGSGAHRTAPSLPAPPTHVAPIFPARKRKLTATQGAKIAAQEREDARADAAAALKERTSTTAAKRATKQLDAKLQAAAPGPLYVYKDFESRTCIAQRHEGYVSFIPFEVEGLELRTLTESEFDQRYKPLTTYAVTQAAKLFLAQAQVIGGSASALEFLGRVVPVSKQEIDMAAAKKRTVADDIRGSKGSKSALLKGKGKGKDKAAGDTQRGPKGPSAAKMFQDLIMAGRKTDDEIFSEVQEEFGLADNKRSYVAWYRNYLHKKGMNPPEAKGGARTGKQAKDDADEAPTPRKGKAAPKAKAKAKGKVGKRAA